MIITEFPHIGKQQIPNHFPTFLIVKPFPNQNYQYMYMVYTTFQEKQFLTFLKFCSKDPNYFNGHFPCQILFWGLSNLCTYLTNFEPIPKSNTKQFPKFQTNMGTLYFSEFHSL